MTDASRRLSRPAKETPTRSAKRFSEDALRAINCIRGTHIPRRRGILVLVFDRKGPRVAGYLNANPYNAARAMVEFLLQEFPDASRPAWLKRAAIRKAKRKRRSGSR